MALSEIVRIVRELYVTKIVGNIFDGRGGCVVAWLLTTMQLVGDSERKASGAYPNFARCQRMSSSQPQPYRTVKEAEGRCSTKDGRVL